MNNLNAVKTIKKFLLIETIIFFDLTNFTWDPFIRGIPVEKIESMTHVVKKLHNDKIINTCFDFHLIEGLSGRMKWHNGILVYKNTIEATLYDLIKI